MALTTAEPIKRLSFQSREDWLSHRRTSIGASDAAAVLGVSRFTSPFALWCEKTGAADLSTEETEYQRWGLLLEPIVRAEYERETGRTVFYEGPYVVHHHPEVTFMSCTLDGLIGGDGVYEGKTAIQFSTHEWNEGPPLYYQVQLQHQLAVTGRQWGSVAVLIGGNRFQWFDQQRNDEFIGILREKIAEFWACVENREPPKTDGHKSTTEALKALFPNDNGDSVPLPLEAIDYDRELIAIKQSIREQEKRKDEIENWMKLHIGNASFGVMPDGTQYSHKLHERAESISKASSFRVLRRLASKGAK